MGRSFESAGLSGFRLISIRVEALFQCGFGGLILPNSSGHCPAISARMASLTSRTGVDVGADLCQLLVRMLAAVEHRASFGHQNVSPSIRPAAGEPGFLIFSQRFDRPDS